MSLWFALLVANSWWSLCDDDDVVSARTIRFPPLASAKESSKRGKVSKRTPLVTRSVRLSSICLFGKNLLEFGFK